MRLHSSYAKQVDEDYRLAWIISMMVLCLFIVNLSAGITELTGMDHSGISFALKVLLAMLFLYGLGIVARRLNHAIIGFIILSIVLSFLNILIFPQNNEFFYQTLLDYWMTCMPLAVYLWVLVDYDILLRKLVSISTFIAIIAVLLILYMVLVKGVLFNNGLYSMGFSYSCLLPCLVLMWDFTQNKKRISLIASVSLLLIIIAFGSRGAVLCFAVFITLLLIKKYGLERKNYIKIIFILLILTLLISNIDIIFLALQNFLLTFNINSRTLNSVNLLLTDEINLSSRNIIYETIFKEFISNLLAIRGINADYLLVGSYTHNIVLELLYEFGLIIAVPILLLLSYFSINTIFNNKKSPKNDLKLIFFSIAIPSLFVSGTLWRSHIFWMWIILCIKGFKMLISNKSLITPSTSALRLSKDI